MGTPITVVELLDSQFLVGTGNPKRSENNAHLPLGMESIDPSKRLPKRQLSNTVPMGRVPSAKRKAQFAGEEHTFTITQVTTRKGRKGVNSIQTGFLIKHVDVPTTSVTRSPLAADTEIQVGKSLDGAQTIPNNTIHPSTHLLKLQVSTTAPANLVSKQARPAESSLTITLPPKGQGSDSAGIRSNVQTTSKRHNPTPFTTRPPKREASKSAQTGTGMEKKARIRNESEVVPVATPDQGVSPLRDLRSLNSETCWKPTSPLLCASIEWLIRKRRRAPANFGTQWHIATLLASQPQTYCTAHRCKASVVAKPQLLPSAWPPSQWLSASKPETLRMWIALCTSLKLKWTTTSNLRCLKDICPR